MHNIKKGGIAVAVIIFVAAVSAFAVTENESAALESAVRLLNQGNHSEALAVYQRILNSTPSHGTAAQVLFLKATAINLFLKQPDRALPLFKQIRADYPDSPAASDALFHMGMILYKKQQYPKAVSTFTMYINQYRQGFRKASAAAWLTRAKEKAHADRLFRTPAPKRFTPDAEIRVLMREGAKRVKLNADKPIHVQNPITGKTVHRGNGPIFFTYRNRQLLLNGRPIGRLCRIDTQAPVISLENTRLRGHLMVALEPDGVQIINHVPIEHYLYGIISKEMPCTWSMDALKAQAVASRTYALYIKGKNRFLPFDVEATTASQVFGGYNSETPQTNAAVDKTRGQVMTHDNRLIVAYFHANSAGHTENASHVWQVRLPYLKGGPDKFSKDLPNSAWQYPLSYAPASTQLNRAGLNIGTIKTIKSIAHSPSGRVLKIAVTGNAGSTVLNANHFRCLLDAKRIKSTFFKITPIPSGVLLTGKGYGHGVGMSQWGANRMAAVGYSHIDILKHYYPGTQLMTLGSI